MEVIALGKKHFMCVCVCSAFVIVLCLLPEGRGANRQCPGWIWSFRILLASINVLQR